MKMHHNAFLVFGFMLFLSMGDGARAQLVETKIFASDAAAQDHFGRAISIHGDFVIVGAQKDDEGKGGTYMYQRDGNDWIEMQKLVDVNGAANDEFGRSVDIDGDYAIVGAYLDDDFGNNSGSAFIYRFDGTTWVEEAKLNPSDASTNDRFGVSVSISGDYTIIGAYRDDDNGSNAGSAYIFKRDGTIWTEEAKLLASDGTNDDELGFSSHISGDYAIVSTRFHNASQGAAYIFEREGTTWTEKTKLTAGDGAAGDEFGSWFTSIDGDYALVGAQNDDDLGDNSGSAYIFYRDVDGNWTEQAKLLPSNGIADDQFGCSASISGDYALVGSFDGAYAYIFKRDVEVWNELYAVTSSDFQEGDDYAYAVAIHGNYAAIGADDDKDFGASSGSAYIYTGYASNPIVSDIPDQSIAQGGDFAAISLDDFVDDPDHLDSEITWTFSGNTDLTVDIDINRIATITAPDSTWTGSETITFTATDPDSFSGSDATTFTVTSGAPVVLDIPDQSINQGEAFSTITLDDFVDDPDHADSEITWTFSGNTDLSVDIDINRIATITSPDTSWTGSEAINFTATDPDGLSDSDDATFTVSAPSGTAPVVSDFVDETITGAFIQYELDDYVDDPDHADSEITWTFSGNTNLIVQYKSDIQLARVSAPSGWSGSETITFTATDPDGFSDSDDATFTVEGSGGDPGPPLVSDIPDATITGLFVQINLDDFVEDPDHADSEITWTFSGNTDLILTYKDTRRVVRVSAPAGWTGSETITFTATDPDANSDSDDASFTVAAARDTDKKAVVSLRNQPNPFNPSTTISFELNQDSWVTVRIFNMLGEEVKTLLNGHQTTGIKNFVWDGTDNSGLSVASGTYIYRIKAGDFVASQKMMFSK